MQARCTFIMQGTKVVMNLYIIFIICSINSYYRYFSTSYKLVINSDAQVEIRADMMIPYHHTKAFGQVPCEDVAMRIPIPEAWIYQFRNEKAHVSFSQLAAGNLNLSSRMGAVKSAHRRAGKVSS